MDNEDDKEIIECLITIDPNEKMIYLDEINCSGCKYSYKNLKDLIDNIKFYFGFYHEDLFKKKKSKRK